MTRVLATFSLVVAIVLVLLGLLGVDVIMGSAVNRQTAEIVDNAVRSIELVNDMGELSRHLIVPDLPRSERLILIERFNAIAREYDPIATFEDERAQWELLRSTMIRLQLETNASDRARLLADGQAVEETVRKLVAINHKSAQASVLEIQRLGRQESLVEGVGVVIAIGLLGVVAYARIRAATRERALLATNVALVEARNRELDAFASRAAHDLRAPLNPIRGYADLIILGDEPPDEMRKLANRIRTGVDRMVRVIENMLDLSRFGQPASGSSSVDDVCAEVLEEMGPELKDAKCTTTLTSEPVDCSPGVLYQILRNLIGNAVKYRSPNRPLEISVTAEVVKGHVIIDVTDNGVGIDPESAKHAFEPFFRARSDVAGHGLGLAIVDRAVQAVGGSCKLSSNIDQGTRVTVQLRRAAVHGV